MSNKTNWILARKRENAPNNMDLRTELDSMDGISIVSATRDRAQIQATPEGIQRIRERLSASFHIEPVAPRSELS
jgi:hypothetical protein